MTNQQAQQETKQSPEREQEKINGYKLQNAAQLPAVEDRRPLVEDFLFDTDTMFLYAPSGSYKSMVAINLAVAVASGGTFMERKAHQAKVLFVDGELSKYSFKQRLELFGTSENLHILSESYQDPALLHLLPPIHIETDSAEEQRHTGRRKLTSQSDNEGKARGWQSALLTLTERNRYGLIVFDNVRTLTNGINENDAADITPLNTLVKRLRYLGCAVLVVHHTRKGEGDGGEAVYAGSTNFLTVYNTCIGIDTVGGDGISFNVIKDREMSVGDYFRETCWRLSEESGIGFVRFDGHSAAMVKMRQLLSDIESGVFTTKGALVEAARKKYFIRFQSKPSAFKALHSTLAEAGAVSDDFSDFDAMVRSCITSQTSEDF
jgi:hypothetical protein